MGALVILTIAATGGGWAQARTVSLQLEPRKPQTLVVSLLPNQVALVHLKLEGGILGIRETAPDKSSRPLWLIDLGREAKLTYITGGSAPGDYAIEITSFEKKRLAGVSVEIASPTPANEMAANLRDAEDLLANAELIRRHWPSAPVGKDAVDLYDRALATATKLDDIPLKRLVLTQKARYFIFSRNRFADANTLLEQAVALPPADDAPQQALAWKTLSSVRYDLGEYQPAITAGLSALGLYRQTHDLYWQGIVLGNLSSVYSEMGRAADALAAAQEALHDAEEERDAAGVVYCLSQLAGLYQQQGDLEGALRAFYQGLAWVSDINYAPLVEAEIQKDLGSFYAQIGNWERAAVALNRCIELEGVQDGPVSLEARGLLATVMQHQGKLSEGIAEATAAIDMAHRSSLKHEEAELLLKRASMQQILRHQDLAEADIEAATAIASALASLPLQVETEVAMGDVQFATNPGKSGASYEKALQLAEAAGEREEQSIALAGLARAFQSQGQLEEAATFIERALNIVEASRGSLTSRELQVSYFSLHRGWYELAVDICMRLDQKYPAGGYALRAFAYTERAHARSLLDTLDSSGYTATMAVDEKLREAYARNQREVAAQQEFLASGHNSEDAAKKLQQLYREQEGLEVRMRSADGSLASVLGSHPADASQVQGKLLDKHSALLSYWIGNSHSYRWSITSDAVSVDELPPRDELERIILPLEVMLHARRPALKPGEDMTTYALQQKRYEAQLQLALKRAGSILLGHIANDVRNVFVVGDGCIAPLPLAALRIPNGATTSYALRRYNFFLEPSASVAVYLKQHPVPEQSLHVTVFADPVFSPSDARLTKGAQLGPVNHRLLFANLQRLTGSTKEAQNLSRFASGGAVTLRTGFDAVPDRVRDLSAKDAYILHFATHTVTVSGHPEITGIALSMWNREGKEQNGIFWLKDIYALRLPSSLVVLSGCETDRQNGHEEEGLNNLAYAFFFAGAHSVVGSLWAVDDSATSRLIDVFYRELLVKHRRADEALREAQLKMLASPQTKSPTAWASFVLEGWPAAYSIEQNNGKSPSSTTHLPMREN